MKIVLGLLMILGGLVLGLYVGVWLCFIGGIVSIIDEIKSPAGVDSLVIAWGIARIFFASILGGLSALILILPGGAMIVSSR